MSKPRVGFLCYGLSPASTTVLNSLVEEADDRFYVKAYPLVFDWGDRSDFKFLYRPTSFPGRYFTFNTVRRNAPEGTLLHLGLRVAWDLVRESDVVCHLGIQGIPAIIATILAKLARKPVVTINQTTLAKAELGRSFWVRFFKKLILKVSNVIVSQTPPTAETLSQVYHIPRSEIVHAPWDGGASEFLPVLEKVRMFPRHQLREQRGIGTEAYVILYCGTLIMYKGVDVLVRAFSSLKKAGLDEALLLVAGGDGKPPGTLSELEKLVAALDLGESVRFLGKQPWDELAKLYLLSDVFVLPTRHDMWPKVLIEAALAGLPLVTTDVCGAAGYLVRDGENGFVVRVNDDLMLSQVLMRLADPNLRSRMGKASEAIAQEYVEASRYQAKGLIEAISRAIGKRV